MKTPRYGIAIVKPRRRGRGAVPREQQENLGPGKYVAIASYSSSQGVQGVWAFTITAKPVMTSERKIEPGV